MTAYQSLVEHYQQIAHFSHVASICYWDQAAMMPKGGNNARSHAMAALSLHIHQLSTSPTLFSLFQKAEKEALHAEEIASLREMKRVYEQSTALPDALVKQKSLVGSTCEHAWRTQRKENDWNGFCKNFEHVVALSQEEANIRAKKTGLTPYEAMMDLYEPGMTTAKLDIIFNDLKSWLPDLTKAVQEKQQKESFIAPEGNFPVASQNALGLAVMKSLGFDFDHGRLDVSMHPFCGGVSQDVRITTRYQENDFQQALMGIIHETGHACYEQNLPTALSGLPVGQARSMGIHESQSLFFEMQMGRSAVFIQSISPLLQQHFSHIDNKVFVPANLNTLYSRVKPGFIRVDADELTYPAHVILRYEIERDLMNGKLGIQDIPVLWQDKMMEYLGVNTDGNYTDGCMQDIHWTDGAFGYFPSYTLGAMYAAQFMNAMKKDVDVDACLTRLDLKPIHHWLNERVWRHASVLSTDDLVIQATGETLNPKYFKDHLIARYL